MVQFFTGINQIFIFRVFGLQNQQVLFRIIVHPLQSSFIINDNGGNFTIINHILLLDEPFGALDVITRNDMQDWLLKLRSELNRTMLLVTHDISEAISLSDRVVVLSHRPAVVKSIHRLTQLQGVPPLQRRDHPAFAGYFKSIWKELEVHEG